MKKLKRFQQERYMNQPADVSEFPLFIEAINYAISALFEESL
jgi:hypothetical protein